jgi:hypothetical protein
MLPPTIGRKLAAAAAIAAGILYVSFVHSYAAALWYKDQTDEEEKEEDKEKEKDSSEE